MLQNSVDVFALQGRILARFGQFVDAAFAAELVIVVEAQFAFSVVSGHMPAVALSVATLILTLFDKVDDADLADLGLVPNDSGEARYPWFQEIPSEMLAYMVDVAGREQPYIVITVRHVIIRYPFQEDVAAVWPQLRFVYQGMFDRIWSISALAGYADWEKDGPSKLTIIPAV